MKREMIVECGRCGAELVIDADEPAPHILDCLACGAVCEFDEAGDAVKTIVEGAARPRGMVP